jgi:hypothetical protein
MGAPTGAATTAAESPLAPPKAADVEAAWKSLKDVELPPLKRAYEFYRLGLYEPGREELEAAYQLAKGARSATFVRAAAERRSRSPYFPANWAKKPKSDLDPVFVDVVPGVKPTKARAALAGAKSKKAAGPVRLPDELDRFVGLAFAALGDAHYPIYIGGGVRGDTRYYPKAYLDDVAPVAGEFGHAPEELWALMHTESLFHRFVASPVGAIGLLQIMPKTGRAIARMIGWDDFRPGALFDSKTNLRFGAWYYARLKEVFHDQLPLAMAAYNGGPYMVGRIIRGKAHTKPELDELIEEIPPRESRLYAKKVLHKVALYQRLYDGKTDLTIDLSLNTDVGGQVDF